MVSVTDVDKALCWGPGLRWGIMGQVLLNHLGGGQGGIEHFFAQFTGPLTAWWKVLGAPELTPAVQAKLAAGLHEEVGSRSIAELEAQRDEILLGLLELRKKVESAASTDEAAAARARCPGIQDATMAERQWRDVGALRDGGRIPLTLR